MTPAWEIGWAWTTSEMPEVTTPSLALCLTPHGRLVLLASPDAPALDPESAARLETAFVRGSGHGLLHLAGAEIGRALPPVFSYWREFAARYLTGICTRPDGAEGDARAGLPAPAESELHKIKRSTSFPQ